MSKRLVVLVVAPLVLFGGASLASASTAAPSSPTHKICIGVTSDPSSSGRDGICIRTDPLT